MLQEAARARRPPRPVVSLLPEPAALAEGAVRLRRLVAARSSQPIAAVLPAPRVAGYKRATMNRLKLWALAALVLAAGWANLHLATRWLVRSAVADADRELQAAAALLDARSQLLAAQASALAEAAARAPALLAALSQEGAGDAVATAAVAVVNAARGMPAEQSRGLLVGTSGPEGTALRAGGRPLELQDPAGGLFAEPLRGNRREGYARASDGVWLVAAVPAGKGGAVAVGLPVDLAWAQALRAASGADVTITAGQPRPISTLGTADLAAVAAAAQGPKPRPVDAGALPRLQTALSWLPPLPLLLAHAPAHRVQAVALRGMKSGTVALSVAMAPALSPVATYQVVSIAALLLLLVAGVVLGLLVTSEVPVVVPRELVHAADRIGRGDYAARVPALAGSMGTVASALNKAAEAAEQAQARPALVPDLFSPAQTPPDAETDPFALRSAAPRAPPAAPDAGGADLFAPAPEEPPPEGARPEPQPFAPLSNSVSGATSLATRPEDLVRPEAAGASVRPPAPPASPPPVAGDARSPGPTLPPDVATALWPGMTPAPVPGAASTPAPVPRAAPPQGAGKPPPAAAAPPVRGRGGSAPADDPDAAHWQEVFEEFLRVRAACSESTRGLTAERFIAKLRSNRTTLMQKHDCRSVRFQVYVKEGRAAVKATPVK